MKKAIPLMLLVLLAAAQVNSQQDTSVPQYLEFDDQILVMRESLRQDRIEMIRSERFEPNEWYADVYGPAPPYYFFQAPLGSVMQDPSATYYGRQIILGPNSLYMIIVYDFEHDSIIEAGEWKDINGNFIAEAEEWFDENMNNVRDFGEWTDSNGNGIVNLGELTDVNGNGVFDIGEWHEGKNTDGDPTNNLPGEFNGAVDPNEWIGMNLDRSITKKLALKIYKRVYTAAVPIWKEMDYKEYVYPTYPERVIQHPALRSMTSLTDNQKLVLLLRLEDCERCEVVGDVAWYEDEFARIVFNFQGFVRETLHTTLPRCEGCYQATVSHYARLQIYVHEKFDLLYEDFYLHSVEPRGLPDNADGTTGYYYSPRDEMYRADRYERRIRSLVSFDPYYLIIRDNNEMVLYETIYGKALIVPYDAKEEEYGSHIYERKYPDGTEKDIRIEVIHVYQIETPSCEQVLVARLLIDEDTEAYNTSSIDPDEKVFTVFYYACDNHFENNVIFPEEYDRGLSDFGIIVEKIELEEEKVWLKFVREVESERIPNPAGFLFGSQDYQIVFDELDRDNPLGMCDYYDKQEENIPRFEKILVDVSLPYRFLLNNAVLKYEDLKGNPNELASYEEQPWEMTEWNTEVTILQLKKIAYNPNAADYTGLGYDDIPIYNPPLNPAPGLVQVGPDLLPNFQISDEDFSGTCIPGDTITFYIEVYNGSGGPMAVQVQDDIPVGMQMDAAQITQLILSGGVLIEILPADGIGNPGETVVWNIPNLPPGYTLLSYNATVVSDGTVGFGGSIINDGCIAQYFETGIPRIAAAPAVEILVQSAQIIKEPFADLACTIPAPTILPGSRLYYRLTVYDTIVNPVSLYHPQVIEVSDVIPIPTINPQYHVSFPGLTPQPIVGNVVLWQGVNVLGSGGSMTGIYSVFVPVGSAGNILNDASVTYVVPFPLPGVTTVTTVSNLAETWIVTQLSQITEPLEPCLSMNISKEGPASQAGGVIRYEITVANRGSGPYADAFNLVIIDKLPQYASGPVNIQSTNPLVTWTTHDSDGDFVDDVIVWKVDQLPAGSDFELTFEITIETTQIPYNCYMIKVFTYDLYKQEEDRYLGMGGISRVAEYKISPTDMTEVIKDSVFTQVMKGAEKLENYLIKVFESRIYDKEFFFQFVEFNEKERSARFKMFERVGSDLDMNVYWGVLEQSTMETGSSQIYSNDTFLAHVLLRNDGTGTISDISYELDAPDFSPMDMTWEYNIEQYLDLDIGPDEQAGLLFLMKAPQVSHETTFPLKVKLTYTDERGTRSETKTAYLNVLAQRRANVQIKKTILEGKSVVKETGKEVADLRVGEERTIVAYIQNLSEDEIEQVHFIDQIPQGLEVIEGYAEWMGALKPGETVKVTYKIKVKQIGIYQFRGKTFYKDEKDHVYEGISNITEIRVITAPGPKLNREVDTTIVSKGDVITVVIRVENDTPTTLEEIQVVDIVPEGFQVESLKTKNLEEDNGAIRIYIDSLKPNKYVLIEYTLRAGEKAGKFTHKGVRLAYENGDGLKEEILTDDQELLIPETETPNISMDYTLRRKIDSDGEYVTTVLTLSNSGGIAAKAIKVVTPLLEGTEFVEASTNYLQENGIMSFMVDEIEAGEQFTVKYTFKIPHFNTDRTYALNFDVVYSDDFDREYSDQLEGELVVRAQKPLITVTKVIEKNAVKLNFSVRVAVNIINEGEIAADTQVSDPLPDGLVLLSGTNAWEGRLEPGESAQIMYEVLCTRVGTFALPQAAAIYSDRWQIDYVAESDPTSLLIRGILIEKSADVADLKTGEVVVVTVTVTNTYDERAANIVIEDMIPEELTLVEGNPGWSIGVLNPGESVTFTYSLKPTKPGTFSLGPARATFIDVYNDKHESSSGSVTINVIEMVPPETKPPTSTPPEEKEKGMGQRVAESFDIAMILLIVLVMFISMVVAFLLIERRRSEEEEYYELEELPAPPREAVYERREEVKKALPTPEERGEAEEEITPLDVLKRRRESLEEKREKVEKVVETKDVHELLRKEGTKARKIPEEFEFGKEPEEFEFGKEPEEFEFGKEFEFGREAEKPRGKGQLAEELGLEDLFVEEESKSTEESPSEFTDVRDILRMPKEKEEPSTKEEPLRWKPEKPDNAEKPHNEFLDIHEIIKGPKKEKEEKKSTTLESPEEDDEDFDPRDILKKRD
ncbi:MAG: DUF11 domain-containing protein [Theionarchaea archaeon]|nr:DUF11 domain-containing protein [Theionarchaea archaeon]